MAKRPLIAANLAMLMLTGCVGAAVDTSFHSAQLQTAGYAEDEGITLPATPAPGTGDAFAEAIDPGESGDLAVASLPVPVPSPISDQPAIEMALGEDIQDASPEPAVAALNTVLPTSPNIVAPASPESPDVAIASEVSEPVLQASLEPQAPEKPKTFFELLFQKRSEANLAKNKPTVSTDAAPVVASVDPSKSLDSMNALPGVNDNKTIFGIDEDALADEAENEGVQVAMIGGYTRSLSASGLALQTDAVKVDCFKPELLQLLKVVELHYGKRVMVTSGYRSPDRNRNAGGVKNSTHIYCKAADIQVDGVSKWDLAKYLRTLDNRGGVGTYCRTESVHVDVGTQRDWHYPCRRKKSKA